MTIVLLLILLIKSFVFFLCIICNLFKKNPFYDLLLVRSVNVVCDISTSVKADQHSDIYVMMIDRLPHNVSEYYCYFQICCHVDT